MRPSSRIADRQRLESGAGALRLVWLVCIPAATSVAIATPAAAQRVEENATLAADDGFGAGVGAERVGLYSGSDVRGFSPSAAGNIRIEGLYIDRVADFSERLIASDRVRVGITAQNYAFAAPTGIDDFALRAAGPKALLSAAAQAVDNGNRRLDLDAQIPLADNLSLAAGAGIFHRVFTSGATGTFASYALRGRWQATDRIEISPFWGRVDTYQRQVSPTFLTASDFIPEGLRDGHYVGPHWAAQRSIASNYGVIAKANSGALQLRAGLFRSVATTPENYSLLLRNLTPAGVADRQLIADPRLKTDSVSGELRLDWRLEEQSRRHLFSLALRGRHRTAVYGGGTAIDYGRGDVNAETVAAKPDFTFGPSTHEKVEQVTPGVGYELRWRGVGSLNLGLQRAIYVKSVHPPGGAVSKGRDPSWLYNASTALTLSDKVALYASASSGLEESGVAPEYAANRRQILPAIHTSQLDAGVRLVAPRGMRVVAGVFDIRKPYFATDANNVFVEAGDIRHRGVELSLTASPAPGLTLVGGAVLMRPRVSGLSVERGLIGKKPVGDVAKVATLNASYSPPIAPKLNFGAGLYYHSPRTASSSNATSTPAALFVDLSARYRLQVADRPAVLKLQASNITDKLDYAVFSSNAFGFNTRRLVSLSFTVDI
jgi:iron complex outermembrane recepter protein